ncbi:methyl-accepting chemotaxis protein [Desulfonatronovibrio hydrogenovorans]|uniref:methyl-accepting chemotaxis protein n=1 Tax=Desulfonatronovibrio hydrogenovorans TaxID=53245 RepID=UPI000554CB37|nr:methyl-accepting chemotaxis protein [Desulfonatronovibrio hydrogenovorans]
MNKKKMILSAQEKKWLPWKGPHGRLALGWSFFLNRDKVSDIEQIFECLAETRKQALLDWAKGQWQFLAELTSQLGQEKSQDETLALLQGGLEKSTDFSELFVVNHQGRLLASSSGQRNTAKSGVHAKALEQGLEKPFLHGPYLDPVTGSLGPSSSSFHDEVTLMFFQPLVRKSGSKDCLCGRVPMDVLGDLIQREAGHIYSDSGDNYLFMVESCFDPSIAPGTALSRSRFEDETFSQGPNLKKGLTAPWGKVKVKNHTEFELNFVNPSTGELLPGVRETIRNGENLFVEYPGYPDYRHVPVIGKGVLLRMPGSADTWGMMCECDLEEAYRPRSIGFQMMRLVLPLTLIPLMVMGLGDVSGLPRSLTYLSALFSAALGCFLYYRRIPAMLTMRLKAMSKIMLDVAECKADLKSRLDLTRMGNDETTQLARWINSFLDKLEGIVEKNSMEAEKARKAEAEAVQAKARADQARQDGMLAAASQLEGVITRVNSAVRELSGQVEQSSKGADDQNHRTSETASAMEEMNATVFEVAKSASNAASGADKAWEEAQTGAQIVEKSIESISRVQDLSSSVKNSLDQLGHKADQISNIMDVIQDIADQTNLLALNAAIEAARAGDAGRGFAVVADEVRKLAEKTMVATKEVEESINLIQAGADDNIRGMDNTVEAVNQAISFANNSGEALRNILAIARDVSGQVSSIAAATEEQSAASEEVNRSLSDISKIASSTVEVMVQATSQIEELSKQSTELQTMVESFKLRK